MTIIQTNVDGLTYNKRAELAMLAASKKADIICIQETKLKTSRSFKTIKGYHLLRKDRQISRQVNGEIEGGGVAILVTNKLRHQEITESPVSNDDDTTEWIGVQISTKAGNLDLYNMYRPPIRTGGQDARTDKFDPEALPGEDNTIIVGDFNCHNIHWDPYAQPDQTGEHLMDTINNGGLAILNDGSSTRKARSTHAESAPDISMISSNLLHISTWKATDNHVGSSDHKVILIEINIDKNFSHSKPRPRPNFRKADWVEYQRLIEEQIRDSEPDTIEAFTNVMLKASELTIPISRPRKRAPLPWLDNEAKQAIKERNQAASRSHLSEQHRQDWTERCQRTDELISRKQSEAWKDKASNFDRNTDVKEIFQTIRAIEGRDKPPTVAAGIYVNGKPVHGDQKATAYAKKIASWSTPSAQVRRDRRREKRDNRKSYANRSNTEGEIPEITTGELKEAIRELNANKAAGPDKIHAEHLKMLPDSAVTILTRLYNGLLADNKGGGCPRAWRTSFVIPILKPGKAPDQLDSYRPISLTSSMSKVMEKVILKRMVPISETDKILSDEQAGFRFARGCEDQVARLVQSIYDANEKAIPGERSILATIDFAHAFPSVSHSKLLKKLLRTNIPLKYIDWIKKFLEDRRSKILFDGESKWKRLETGAGLPQGSVLSPFLFTVFVDDLIREVKSKHPDTKISMFADDLALWSQGTIAEAQQKLQPALITLENWSTTNGMEISPTKSAAMLFTLHTKEVKAPLNLTLCGSRLSTERECKFLGVKMDGMLSFRKHATDIATKATSRLNAMKCLSGLHWGQKEATLKQLGKATVEAVTGYGAGIYATFGCKSAKEGVNKVLRATARVVTGCTKSTPIGPLLAEARIHEIDEVANEKAAIQLEKASRVAGHPLEKMANEGTQKNRRYKRRIGNFNDNGLNLIQEAGLKGLTKEEFPGPKQRAEPNVTIYETAVEKAKPNEERRRSAETALSDIPEADIEIWSDGSAHGGYELGGSGGVIVFPNGTREKYKTAAGRFCSSYRAEVTAIREGLKKIPVHMRQGRLRVCTDSSSAIQSLAKGGQKQKCQLVIEILQELTKYQRVQLVHVPAM